MFSIPESHLARIAAAAVFSRTVGSRYDKSLRRASSSITTCRDESNSLAISSLSFSTVTNAREPVFQDAG
jgi:hypothetical protein